MKEYVVKIKGDISDLQDAVKKASGETRRLSKDEVLIKLNYDGNIKEFNKVFDSVLKTHPELTVQLQYNANKKILDEELNKLKKLQDIKVDIDNGQVNKKLSSMTSEIDEMIKKGSSEDIVKNKINEFFSYASIVKQQGRKIGIHFSDELYAALEKTQFIDLYNKLWEQFDDNPEKLNLLKFSGNIDKEVQNTEERIQDLKKYMDDLEQKGATKLGVTSEVQDLQDQIKILRSDIDEMQLKMEGLDGSAFEEISKKVQDLSGDLQTCLDKLDLMQGPKKQDFSSLGNFIENEKDQILLYGKKKGGKNAEPSYWEDLAKYQDELDEEYQSMLKELGFMSEKSLKPITDGANNLGGLIGDQNTLLFKNSNINEYKELKNVMDQLADSGLNFGRILDIVEDKESELFAVVMESRKGIALQDENFILNKDALEASDESINKLLSDMKELYAHGIETDVYNPSNILYDKDSKSFSILDMDLKHDFDSFEDMIKAFAENLKAEANAIRESGDDLDTALKLDSFVDKISNFTSQMVGESVSQVQEVQQSNSPSKVTEKLGQDFADGYAKGIEESIPKVKKAAEKMAETTSSSISIDNIKKATSNSDRDKYLSIWHARFIGQRINDKVIDDSRADNKIRELLKHNPELFEDLSEKKRKLDEKKAKEAALRKAVSELSEETSVKDISNDDIADEAVKLFDFLNSKGLRRGETTDDQEIINAQIKLGKLLDRERKMAGKTGVSAATRDQWIVNAWEDQTGRDLSELSNIMAVGDNYPPKWSIFKNSKMKRMQDIVRDLNPALSESNKYLNKAERTELAEINAVLEYMEEKGLGVSKVLSDVNEQAKKIESSTEEETDISFMQKCEDWVNARAKRFQLERELKEENERLASSAMQASSINESALRNQFDEMERVKQESKEVAESFEKEGEAAKEASISAKQTRTTEGTPESSLDEIGSLDRMKNSLTEIIELVDKKTQAFLDEETLVGSSLNNEDADLNILLGTLSLIVEALKSISSSTTGNGIRLSTELKALFKMVDQTDISNLKDSFYSIGGALKELTDVIDKMDAAKLKDLSDALKSAKNAGSIKIGEDKKKTDFSAAFKDADALYSKRTRYQKKKLDAIIDNDSGLVEKYENKIKDIDEQIELQKKLITKEEESKELAKKEAEQKEDLQDYAEGKFFSMNKNTANTIESSKNFLNRNKHKPAQYEEYKAQYEELQKVITSLKEYKEQLEQININGGNVKQDKFDEIAENLAKARQEANKLKAEMNGISSDSQKKFVDPAKIQQEAASLAAYLDKYDGMGAAFKQQLEGCLDKLQRMAQRANVTDKEFNEMKATIAGVKTEINKAGKQTDSMMSRIGKAMKSRLAQQVAMYTSLQDFIRYGREVVGIVTDIDTAITELRKVSGESEGRLSESFKQSAETAKDLGASITEVINSTSDWSRLGYNIGDAEELARVTTLYQNVGDNITQEEASKSLVSTLQGFQMKADQSEEIVDKFNEVANNFAIDTLGIGEALQRSAASFNAAQTDLSKSIALVTATNTVVQNPDAVGTLWKTMSARIRGADTELKELGEDQDEFTETTSKLQNLVKSLTGFDIMKDANNYKDLYEIVVGIGEHWKELSDIEQASLGEALAGKRNANGLYAVLNNIDTLKAAYETAEGSAGSAMKEQENYEKSISYSIERLTASAQEMATSFLDSGLVKWVVDFGKAFLDASKFVNDFAGSLTTVSTVLAGILSFKNIGMFKYKDNGKGGLGLNILGVDSSKIKEDFSNLNKFRKLTSLKDAGQIAFYNGITGIKKTASDVWFGDSKKIDAIVQFKEKIESGEEASKAFSTTVGKLDSQTQDLARDFVKGNITLEQVSSTLNNVGLKAKLAATGMKLLSMAGNMIATMAISWTISTIISKLEELAHAEENTKKAAESLSTDLSGFNKEVEENRAKYNDLAKTYHELSGGVDELGHNVSLSSEQFKTYNDTVSSMLEMNDGILSFWNDQGNAIINVGNNLQYTNEQYASTLRNKAIKKLEGDGEDEDSIDDIYDNINNLQDSSNAISEESYNQYKEAKKLTKEQLKDLLSFDETVDSMTLGVFRNFDTESNKIFNTLYNKMPTVYRDLIKKYGDIFNTHLTDGIFEKKYEEIKQFIDEKISSYEVEKTARDQQFQSGLLTQAESLSEYWALDNDEANIVSKMISGINDETRRQLGLTSPELGRQWILGIIQGINDEGKVVKDAFNGLMNLDLKELSFTAASTMIEDYLGRIAKELNLKIYDKNGNDISIEILKQLFGFDKYEETAKAYSRAVALGGNGRYGRNLGTNQEISDTMDRLGINTDEEIAKWTEIEQRANSLDNAINLYTKDVTNASNATSSFEKIWKSKGLTDSEKDAKNELLELAKAGKLTAAEFKKNDFGQKLMKESGKEAETLIQKINRLKQVSAVQQLSSMRTGIKAIQDATTEKRDNKKNEIAASTLSSLRDTLGVADKTNPWSEKDLKVWEKYEQVAASTKTTMTQMKKAQDDLATTYVNSNNFLSSLVNSKGKVTQATKEEYYALLDEMGVKNAKQVVDQQSEAAELRYAQVASNSILKKYDLVNATDAEIAALSNEISALNVSGDAIYKYQAAKMFANGSTLSTENDIKQLEALANACGATIGAIDAVQKAKTYVNKRARARTKLGTPKSAMADNSNYQSKDALKKYDAETDAHVKKLLKVKTPKVKLKISDAPLKKTKDGGNGNKGGNGSSNKNTQKKEKQEIDWLERRINNITNLIDFISAKIENIGKYRFNIKKQLGLSEKNDKNRIADVNKQLGKQISYYKTLYKVNKKATSVYSSKANSYKKKLQDTKVNTGKGKKKKKKKLGKKKTAAIIKKIQSDGITTAELKKKKKYWIQKYGEDVYNAIESYITYYDKSLNSKKSMQENIQQVRELKKQQYQNKAELASSYAEMTEAKRGNMNTYGVSNGKKAYAEQIKNIDSQIKYYKESYENQIEAAKLDNDNAEVQKLIAEKIDKLRELNAQKLDIIHEDFENQRALNERYIKDAQNLVDIAEARGSRVQTSWYRSMIENEKQEIAKSKQERAALIDQLKKNIALGKDNGGYDYGSQEYEDAMNKIQETENSIAEHTKSLSNDLSKIREIINGLYDEIRQRYSRISDDAQFFVSLMEPKEKINEDTARFTSEGYATLGSYGIQLATAQASAQYSQEQYENLARVVADAKGKGGLQTLLEQTDYESIEAAEEDLNKYYDTWKSNIQDVASAQQNMISMMNDYYKAQEEHLADIIEAKKKILNTEKDLYDYSKNINEKTKAISTLEKRLAGVAGDQSEEGQARAFQIQKDLDKAREDLQDTEYERWLTDQQNMMDNLAEQYNDIIDHHLKKTDDLIIEAKNAIEENGAEIAKTFEEYAGHNENKDWNIPFTGEFQSVLTDFTGVFGKSGTVTKLFGSDGALISNLNDIVGDLKLLIGKESGSNGGIVPDKANDAENIGKPPSGNGSNNGNTGKKSAGTTVDNTNYENLLWNWMRENGSIPKKKKAKDYSPLNEHLFNRYGRVLTEKQAKKLSSAMRVKWDGKWSKNSNLYKFFQSHIKGFKTGGIGKLVKANGEDGLAMVRNGEGFVAPEHVEAIQKLLKIVPDMSENLSAVPATRVENSGNTNVENFTIELPNVTDPDSFVREFQNNKKVQRIFKIGVEDIVKKGSLSNQIYKV